MSGRSDTTTVTMDDFGGGIDRRVGVVSRAANKFHELRNYVITAGRKLTRRPPLRQLVGQLASVTQGGFYLNGQIVSVAPAGAVVASTLGGVPTRTAFFDAPPNAGVGWRLLDLQAFNERLVALIAHSFDSTAAERVFLHVWDDKRPTFVTDPACPASWSPSLPLHAMGKGVVGAYAAFSPRMAISSDRIYISRPDGNVAFSGVGSPRVWNTRTPEEFLTEGRWWYWISTNHPGDLTITLDVPYRDLTIDARYAAYVCEVCLPDGTWFQLREQNIITAYGDYRIEAVADPYKPLAPTVAKLTVRFPGDGRVYRFRACAKPPVILASGLYVTPDRTVVGGVLNHDGDGHLVPSYQTPVLPTPSADYYIAVGVPGSPIPIPTMAEGVVGSMPFNGQERYWSRILANVEADGTGDNFLYRLTGTVTITVNGTRVVGVGSVFREELEVGRQIEVNGERRVVRTILGDLIVEVDAPFTSAYTGIALRDPRYRYAYEIGDTGSAWYAEREAEATFLLSGVDDAGYLGTATYDSSGEAPRSIATLQDRLLVQFSASLQLWAVGPRALTDMRLLSKDGQASGIHTAPQPTLIDGYSAIPTANGVRLFSPSGDLKGYIAFIGVGDLLRGLPVPDLTRAIWWPQLRAFITCASTSTGPLTFFTLFKHDDTKVLAWALWQFAAISRVDGLFIHLGDLHIRSDRAVYRVATADLDFIDDSDADAAPFESFARWVYSDLGSPQRNKKLTICEVTQVGACSVSVYMNPYALTEATPGPPSVAGNTQGRQRVPLAVMGPGIGLAVSSRDRTGHELDAIGFDYTLRNR
jgi:hypothetical protein